MTTRSGALTADAFDTLLGRFHPERELAGEQYERLRRRLVRFFDCRGSALAEDDADETLNRLARRIHQGEHVQDIGPYALGIARLVFRERARASHRTVAMEPLEMSGIPDAPGSRLDLDRRLGCVDRCLAACAPADRKLILKYYQGDSGDRIVGRKALARDLGLPINALRIRAFRIRQQLQACVAGCAAEGSPRNESGPAHTH